MWIAFSRIYQFVHRRGIYILLIKCLTSSCLKLCHFSCTALRRQYTLLKINITKDARTHACTHTQRIRFHANAVECLSNAKSKTHACICTSIRTYTKLKRVKIWNLHFNFFFDKVSYNNLFINYTEFTKKNCPLYNTFFKTV